MTWTLGDLEPQLRASKDEWRWHTAKVISEIPEGHLALYGTIARVTNQRTGLKICSTWLAVTSERRWVFSLVLEVPYRMRFCITYARASWNSSAATVHAEALGLGSQQYQLVTIDT